MVTTEPTLTPDDLAHLAHPTLVSSATTISCGSITPSRSTSPSGGSLCVVPGASHAVVIERPQLVASTIAEFLSGPEPPETLLPLPPPELMTGAARFPFRITGCGSARGGLP